MVVSGDGWQGPVSIGIFLGLHALLKDFPGGSGGHWVEVDVELYVIHGQP